MLYIYQLKNKITLRIIYQYFIYIYIDDDHQANAWYGIRKEERRQEDKGQATTI